MNAYSSLSKPMLNAPALWLGEIFGDVVSDFLVPRRMLVSRIQATVAEYFRIPEEEMRSPSKVRHIARPRQVAMYLARKLTPKSYPDIGRLFGDRDHTTVIHAVRQVEKLCANDSDFAADVAVLRDRLTA